MKATSKVAYFEMEKLGDLALGIGVTGLIAAFTLEILGDQRDDMATCQSGYTLNANSNSCLNASNSSGTATNVIGTAQYNGTVQAIAGVAKVPAKLGTIATVAIAVFIISLLLVGFAFVRGKQD